MSRAEHLTSDGVVEENGTIPVTTTSGATLTREKVLSAPQARDQRKRERAQQQLHAQQERQRNAEERERLAKQPQRDAELERQYNIDLRTRRQLQQRVLSLTRKDRRLNAKRKFSDVAITDPLIERRQRRKV